MKKKLLSITLLFFGALNAGKGKKWMKELSWDPSEGGCACSTKEEIKKAREEKIFLRETAGSSAALFSSPKTPTNEDIRDALFQLSRSPRSKK